MRDLRIALRSIFGSPGLSILAVTILVLGIGATTVTFSFFNSALLASLPYKNPDRLAMLWQANPKMGGFIAERLPVSLHRYAEWKREIDFASELGGFQETSVVLSGAQHEQLAAARITDGFLKLLGVSPAAGSGFQASDYSRREAPAVLLSDRFATERFGSARGALGRQITLDGGSRTIVGILPAGFTLPAKWQGLQHTDPEVWLPLNEQAASRAEAAALSTFVIARLKPGIALSQARSRMHLISEQLERTDPTAGAEMGASVFPLSEEDVGPAARRTMWALQLAVLLVLVIGAANIATLLLIRAASRVHETAVRLAMGANPWRLFRGNLLESAVLSLTGGALGMAAGVWGVKYVESVAPVTNYHFHNIHITWTVIAFALGLSLCCALVFGAAPTLFFLGQNPRGLLSSAQRGASRNIGSKVRNSFVVAEIALTMTLLTASGVMIRSLEKMLETDAGFESAHLLTAHLSVSAERAQSDAQLRAFDRALIDSIDRIPGVRSASLASTLPMLDKIVATNFTIDGRAADVRNPLISDAASVGADYFKTVGAHLLRGRFFDQSEIEKKDAPMAIVNETFVRQFLSPGDPLGHVISSPASHLRRTVIGVVADNHELGLDAPSRPQMFFPSDELRDMAVLVRTDGSPASLKDAVERAVSSLSPNDPLTQLMPMTERMKNGSASRRFNMELFACFAAAALIMSVAGLYGFLSHLVTLQRMEFGVRMTFGARERDLIGYVVKQGLRMSIVGIVIGILTSLAASSLMANLVFEVSPADPGTIAIVSILVLAVSLLGSYLPARRAAHVDPMDCLRTA